MFELCLARMNSEIFNIFKKSDKRPAVPSIDEHLKSLFNEPYNQVFLISTLQLLAHTVRDNEKINMRNILMLGCGRGLEFVANRIFFGPEVKMTGVDNQSRLSGDSELELNKSVAKADFILTDMKNMSLIIDRNGNPDLILLRHPLPCEKTLKETQTAIEEYGESLSPWVVYASLHQIPLIISFYQKEKTLRSLFQNQLTQIARENHFSLNINLGDKQKNAWIYQDDDGFQLVPDYWWIRIN
jgi:hypothetical protein